jgi:hypothetical protein
LVNGFVQLVGWFAGYRVRFVEQLHALSKIAGQTFLSECT